MGKIYNYLGLTCGYINTGQSDLERKENYLKSSTEQRSEFIEVFKNSLLDTYASTLAQWGNQKMQPM